MIKILLVAPTTGGNGGIVSWTRKYLKSFISKDFQLISVDSSLKHRLFTENSSLKRIYAGLLDLRNIVKHIKLILKVEPIRIMHITTSGSFGTLRDYVLCKICKKKGIKTIMHCRYGNIPEIIQSTYIHAMFLLMTMKMFDQVWVLDSTTEKTLKTVGFLKKKVYLIPNCIDVPPSYDNSPKTFKKVAFIGNLVPSKGLFELIRAVLEINKDISLYIVGHGDKTVNQKISTMCKGYLGTKIHVMGALPNDEAVEFIKTIDILALPTYYPAEAFPISILEAMSYGKLVISTSRAAIPDMLTAQDGSLCGILVKERNFAAIKEAIEYCIDHPDESNIMCNRAYEKVRHVYRNDVVYSIYENNYKMLV